MIFDLGFNNIYPNIEKAYSSARKIFSSEFPYASYSILDSSSPTGYREILIFNDDFINKIKVFEAASDGAIISNLHAEEDRIYKQYLQFNTENRSSADIPSKIDTRDYFVYTKLKDWLDDSITNPTAPAS